MKDEPLAHADTSIATDKNTAVTTSTATNSRFGRSDDEKSLDAEEWTSDIPDFTPPLRIHATRVPERLSGSASVLQIPPGLQGQVQARRRKSDSAMLSTLSSRSGSRSPGNTNFDGGSSLSSLEEVIDPDILTDKMGLVELDCKDHSSNRGLNASCSNLPPVTERMSEETLEDCHAFSDVRRDGSVSRGNSITTGGEVSSNILEPLDECDDEDSNEGGQVILTNMEEILEVAEEEIHDSPSLPTT